ncbi:programmed cell death protein 6-like isoform X3 [Mucor ambiguus]|uniref:Programmed cell death protein 6-like isoform X3 n=1 Tax=Mucor ambiguus TaxID=91626 RepID=A0A0C9M5J4_9FUNG|nr:programmed cell death protein 6-like isoform X3 [Mucor ambiguus]
MYPYGGQQQGAPFYQNNPYQSPAPAMQQQQQQPYHHNPYHRQSTIPNFNTLQHQPPPSLHQANFNYAPLQRSNTFSKSRGDQQMRLKDIVNVAFLNRVDTDRSGSISVHELQTALVNGDWSPFNIETVRMMVSIFDTDNNGTIDFREFRGLWKYVEDWSHCFKKFDQDNSGSIDCYEMSHALRTFGYNMSNKVLMAIGNGDITFDCFVQACVTLSTLTKSFRARDHDGRGSIQINYEDFLTLVISSRPDMKGS